MKRIRVGIIGANPERGWAKVAHVPALKALAQQYEITAVSTTRRASAEEAARQFGAAHAFDRAEALVAHPEVDLVTVSVKTPDHGRAVRAALDAGKHVFCEWPLGANTAEAEELSARADAKGVRTAIGLQRRFWPSVLYVRDLVREGAIGRLRSCNLSYPVPYMGARMPAYGAYASDAANGATLLSIMGGHFLDIVSFALGDIRELSAVVTQQFDTMTILETQEVIPVTSPHQVLVSGTFDGNAVLAAHFEAGKERGGTDLLIRITGTEGALELRSEPAELDPSDLALFGARGDATALEKYTVPSQYYGPHGTELRGSSYALAQVYAALAHDIAEGTSLAPSFRDAVSRHRLLDVIATASSTGQRQRVAA
ncbi:Gfo/Idh/MocA family oxidoreductase [Pendulispora rubella]|uniref:Gfo/Idh/MocA family oxidoreductase n=1 Tax=Pendulispora rubella TaxID=2741070 RepID=A0ABZ2LEE1_9BACT